MERGRGIAVPRNGRRRAGHQRLSAVGVGNLRGEDDGHIPSRCISFVDHDGGVGDRIIVLGRDGHRVSSR